MTPAKSVAALVVGVSALVLGGLWWQSSVERERMIAKSSTQVAAAIDSLAFPPDATLVFKNNFGNWKWRYAKSYAFYATNIAPEKLCALFREHAHTSGWAEYPHGWKCDVRQSVYSLSGYKSFSDRTERLSFELHATTKWQSPGLSPYVGLTLMDYIREAATFGTTVFVVSASYWEDLAWKHPHCPKLYDDGCNDASWGKPVVRWTPPVSAKR